jgi:hypothetical protein
MIWPPIYGHNMVWNKSTYIMAILMLVTLLHKMESMEMEKMAIL